MMNKMIVANLVRRPIRSLISISAVALEVILILLIVSFFYGQLNGSKASQLGVGADVMVQPPGSSALVGVTGAPMPVKVGVAGQWQTIRPTEEWQTMKTPLTKESFAVATDLYYINVDKM